MGRISLRCMQILCGELGLGRQFEVVGTFFEEIALSCLAPTGPVEGRGTAFDETCRCSGLNCCGARVLTEGEKAKGEPSALCRVGDHFGVKEAVLGGNAVEDNLEASKGAFAETEVVGQLVVGFDSTLKTK